MPFFRFAQVEYPWALGPPDGRYLLRAPGDPPDAPATHVLALMTLGAPERRRRDTAEAGDVVAIEIDGIGRLVNHVAVVRHSGARALPRL